MRITFKCRTLILLASLSVAFFCSADQELLKVQDINVVMKQIFEQHVDQKAMTTSILKKSFKVYIDQFDPDRVYLLDSEVKPFFDISDAKIEQFMNQNEHNQYSDFSDLNDVIIKAITRSRDIRSRLEKEDVALLFREKNPLAPSGDDDWSDPDLKRSFPKTESELTQRLKNELRRFIANEQRRYGVPYVAERQLQTIRLFERHLIEHENQYLFVNDDGKNMSDAEKQNAFSMHILKALASSLDAHTTVLNPTEAYDMRVRLEKEVQGVGIALQSTPDGYTITQLVKDGPAEKSGLVFVNDKIIDIDGNQTKGQSLNKVLDTLQGKKGSTVTLTLKRTVPDQRGGNVEKTVNVTLTREDIAVNEDRALTNFIPLEGGGIIGVIKLDSFYQGDNGINSEDDVRDAIKQLDQHGNMRGLILDLRENSGGFLNQAVKVAGLFITNGVIVVSKYFNGEEHFYRDMDGKIAYDGPLIVLTSKATASAAEIVAQALQDYGVALVVGDEHTYGKGTIQSQTVTGSGNQASTFFKVTVGKYYTVSGKTPQIQGVKADIVVPGIFAHENMGEEYLDFPLKPDVIPSSYDDNLADIAPNLKSWYMRYYTPTLQHKKKFWLSVLPQLKEDSEKRIAQNKNYQDYVKGTPPDKNVNIGDLQVAEVIAVMKDMIRLQERLRGTEIELDGQPAHIAK